MKQADEGGERDLFQSADAQQQKNGAAGSRSLAASLQFNSSVSGLEP